MEGVKIGQDKRTAGHFISFDCKKAYLIYCSCDAFILAFSKLFDYADEMREAINSRDITRIVEIIRSCEDYVKSIEDYEKFLEEEIDKHVENSIVKEYEYVDVFEEFDDVVVI